MKYRKLRIAWSVAWGIACLLLIALWVRSYTRGDALSRISATRIVELSSNCGRFKIRRELPFPSITGRSIFQNPARTMFLSRPTWNDVHGVGEYRILGFVWYHQGIVAYAGIPYWFICLSIAGMAVIPWLPWKFSLRTLLIVAILVAVGLGWAVYTLRQ